jgi:lysophospholipase L1-like esterase
VRRRLRMGCLVLLVTVVVGEAGVRIWDRFHGKTGSLYDFVIPGKDRFTLRPETSVIVPERYGNIGYSFNRQGYRDAEPAAGPGVRRIVLLGDSVAFGLGVNQDRIFAHLLERRLQAATGQPWDIANLAVFAYDTGNELAALKEDGLRLEPELVVVQFLMNDFSIPASAGGPAPPPSLGDRLTAAKNRLVYRSAFYRRLHQAASGLAYLAVHDARRRWFTDTLNDSQPRQQLAMLKATPDDSTIAAFRALATIRDVSRVAGATTLVLLVPDEVQLYTDRYDAINRRVAAFCRHDGIALVDALPVLRTSPARRDLFLDGVHLTEAGHRLVADLLFRELRLRNFQESPATP